MALSAVNPLRLRGPTSAFRLLRPIYHTTTTTNAVVQTRSTSTTSLTGRTCLITGGTSGIGHAIAGRFLREGVERVILVGRSYERLVDAGRRLEGGAARGTGTGVGGIDNEDEVATRMPEEDNQDGTSTVNGRESGGDEASQKQNGTLIQSSNRISLLIGDVGEAGGWMKELEREMESVDILVNAAGLSTSSILPKTDLPDISRILRTNLEGAILTSRALIRASIRAQARTRRNRLQDSGQSRPTKCIIYISSLLASKAGTGAVSYAASKAGLLGLTRSLAVESANSLRDVVVRSNAIVPGYIDTPMISDFSDGETARLKEAIPLRRFGEVDEVADAVVFLARNEYANNCVLNLDGGLSAV